MFAQARRIHSLIPYTILKNTLRYANPALVMSGVLDLFLAQPFGTKSLMQRIFGMTLGESIKAFQKSIDSLKVKIEDPILCEKLGNFINADEAVKNDLRKEAEEEQMDLIVVILRSELLQPELKAEQIGKVFNAYVAWNNAVENVDEEMKQGAQLFAYMKQLLKLLTRQRDKAMMASLVEEVRREVQTDLAHANNFSPSRSNSSATFSPSSINPSFASTKRPTSTILYQTSHPSPKTPSPLSKRLSAKMSLQTRIKQCKPSLIYAHAIRMTFTNSCMRFIFMITASSKHLCPGSKESSSSYVKVLKEGN